jgi:hypothetical protein
MMNRDFGPAPCLLAGRQRKLLSLGIRCNIQHACGHVGLWASFVPLPDFGPIEDNTLISYEI